MTAATLGNMTAAAFELGLPWTEAKYLALGDSLDRVELLDGSLLVSPAPTGRHQSISGRLLIALMPAAEEAGYDVVEAVNVRLRLGRICIPDLVLVGDVDRATFDAAEVALVCEIVSPSNAATDRVLKRHLYAAAGIDWYLLLEQQNPGVTGQLFRRVGDEYTEDQIAKPGEVLHFSEPIRTDLAMDALFRHA